MNIRAARICVLPKRYFLEIPKNVMSVSRWLRIYYCVAIYIYYKIQEENFRLLLIALVSCTRAPGKNLIKKSLPFINSIWVKVCRLVLVCQPDPANNLPISTPVVWDLVWRITFLMVCFCAIAAWELLWKFGGMTYYCTCKWPDTLFHVHNKRVLIFWMPKKNVVQPSWWEDKWIMACPWTFKRKVTKTTRNGTTTRTTKTWRRKTTIAMCRPATLLMQTMNLAITISSQTTKKSKMCCNGINAFKCTPDTWKRLEELIDRDRSQAPCTLKSTNRPPWTKVKNINSSNTKL